MSLTFEEAIKRSIESYWRGIEPERTSKLGEKKPKYTKKFFDRFEADKFGEDKTQSKEVEKGNWS